MLNQLKKELSDKSNSEKAKILQGFFKTGKGEYGEGDIFIGLTSQQIKNIAKKYLELNLSDTQELLNSKIHEERMCALRILLNKYKKAKRNSLKKREIFEFYMKNTENINSWDLVDISAPSIVGDFLQIEGTPFLKQLADSKNLWERRISIVATHYFIKKKNFGETLFIADTLRNDEHDLIHKAVGWMLREIGKRNKNVLEVFLSTRYKEMPRTMLRYAIEKFPKEERKKYLKGEI